MPPTPPKPHAPRKPRKKELQQRSAGAGRPTNSWAAYPHLNRSELARKIGGVHVGHLCNVLTGRVGVSTEMAGKIAEAVGVGVGEFMLALKAAKEAGEKSEKKV